MPSYLGMFTYVANFPSRRLLRSSCSNFLIQLPVHCSLVGKRANITWRSTGERQYTLWPPKNWHTFLYALTSYDLTSSNIDRFSNLFHCLNKQNICNNTVTKDPTTPQVCRYTTLRNVSVLTVTTENKTISVITNFKKLTTGNRVYCLSYYPK